MPRLFNAVFFLACAAAVWAADANTDDDKPGSRPVGGYVPEKSLAAAALAAYTLSGLVHSYYFFAVPPRRWFICALPLGMFAMAIGFGIRIAYSNGPPYSLGVYIITTLFILLSPCLYLATDYMILSHLAQNFDDEVSKRCLAISHSRITKIFVWADISTFLIQSAGGGLTASKEIKTADLGSKLALVGLTLQAVSFGLFTVVLIVFAWRMSKLYPQLWYPKNPRPFKVFSRQPIDDWRIIIYLMLVTCVGILVRSIFRIIEFAGGYRGAVYTHEWYFYAFDTLPLWLSMTVFAIVWPTRAIMKRGENIELSSTQSFAKGSA
ncbi:RTA1 like protein-domain-containing protein [Favolaschia claudopus]|uniref:RTA1 like protein-domain-containing protein n=1 Tax=Favolaschia claudopus TaxID=2862362 RepID=A0AAW0DBK3_9AGAR